MVSQRAVGRGFATSVLDNNKEGRTRSMAEHARNEYDKAVHTATHRPRHLSAEEWHVKEEGLTKAAGQSPQLNA